MILEYHKDKKTIPLSIADKEQRTEETQQKRQSYLERWLEQNEWAGTISVEKPEIPETEYLVLDPWQDVNQVHDRLLDEGLEPDLAEQGADDSWMRFTFREGTDLGEARKIIEG